MIGTVGPPVEWVYFVYIPALLLIALVFTVIARTLAGSRARAKAVVGEAGGSRLRSVVVFLLTLVAFFVIVVILVPLIIFLADW